jgi:hypothetical protein
MSQPTKRLRVDTGADKQTTKTRTDRATKVAAVSPTSLLFQGQPPIKDAGAALILAGNDLGDADSAVTAAEAVVEQKRSEREAKRGAFDAAYDIFTALVVHHAETPEQIQGVGLDVLDRTSHALVPPLAIRARFDLVKSLLRISVKQAPGMQACVIDVSQNPSDPTSWKRIAGIGASRSLPGYASGTYWLRAASVRASEQSDFTMPISVVIK